MYVSAYQLNQAHCVKPVDLIMQMELTLRLCIIYQQHCALPIRGLHLFEHYYEKTILPIMSCKHHLQKQTKCNQAKIAITLIVTHTVVPFAKQYGDVPSPSPPVK